jgi:hypothetical protein
MAPWPGVRAAYSKFYRSGAAFLFGSFGSKGVVCFRQSGDVEYDINVGLYNRDRRNWDGIVVGVWAHHTSRRDGYMYTAFMTALILATPIPFRRKGWALLCGLILMHGFIALKLAIRILHAFNSEPQLSLFAPNPFWKQVLSITHEAFAVNVTFGFIVSFFIWILVSFRREDWSRILMQKSPRGA